MINALLSNILNSLLLKCFAIFHLGLGHSWTVRILELDVTFQFLVISISRVLIQVKALKE